MNTNLLDYGNPEPVVIVESELGEGPFWHEKQQLLFWLDCFSNRINIFNPLDDTSRYLILPEVIGSIAPASKELETHPDCTLIAAMESGFYLLEIPELYEGGIREGRIVNYKLKPLVNPESGIKGNRFNDGKCDSAGRFWAGTMSRALDSGAGDLTPKGSFYKLELRKGSDPKKYFTSVNRQIEKVIISNGLAFSSDSKTLYYNDSPTRKITAFSFNINKGEISNRQTVFEVPEGWGNPDGMTIDSEGMLWTALWDGFRVIRVDPHTGKAVGEVRVPVRNVTSCAFGGKELDELYITTSRSGLEGDKKTDPQLAGALFKIKLPVKGLPVDEVQLI